MGAEDLNQRDLQSRNLAVHENSRQVELHLETDVDIGAVDGWRPPQRKSTVGNLVQTGALGVCQLLVFHRLFEAGGFLPKETFPGREIGSLEESVLEDALNATKRLNHVCSVVVEVPQFSVVTLMRPPEGILLQDLILFELQ